MVHGAARFGHKSCTVRCGGEPVKPTPYIPHLRSHGELRFGSVRICFFFRIVRCGADFGFWLPILSRRCADRSTIIRVSFAKPWNHMSYGAVGFGKKNARHRTTPYDIRKSCTAKIVPHKWHDYVRIIYMMLLGILRTAFPYHHHTIPYYTIPIYPFINLSSFSSFSLLSRPRAEREPATCIPGTWYIFIISSWSIGTPIFGFCPKK